MRKSWLLFNNLLASASKLLKRKERPKTLQVVFQFSPSFELWVGYFDLSWSPRQGAMFGKSYPLWQAVRAIYEAVEYAKSEGYELLRVDYAELGRPLKTARVITVCQTT